MSCVAGLKGLSLKHCRYSPGPGHPHLSSELLQQLPLPSSSFPATTPTPQSKTVDESTPQLEKLQWLLFTLKELSLSLCLMPASSFIQQNFFHVSPKTALSRLQEYRTEQPPSYSCLWALCLLTPAHSSFPDPCITDLGPYVLFCFHQNTL